MGQLFMCLDLCLKHVDAISTGTIKGLFNLSGRNFYVLRVPNSPKEQGNHSRDTATCDQL